MSRVPPTLARRLDRLSRRAHAFHRLAHHPLCSAYQGELVHLRRRALCRGCSLAAIGAASGIVIGILAPAPPAAVLAVLVASAAAGLGTALSPSQAPRRRSKLLTRWAPAALLAALATWGARMASLPGAAACAAAIAMAVSASALYRRRGPDRAPCRACPERGEPRVCSGFRRIARREAAFARLAGRLLRS